MPNICFIRFKKKKRKACWFSSLFSELFGRGVSQPPVHIQHSRGEREARGAVHWRNVIQPSSHSIKGECEEFARARYYCICALAWPAVGGVAGQLQPPVEILIRSNFPLFKMIWTNRMRLLEVVTAALNHCTACSWITHILHLLW